MRQSQNVPFSLPPFLSQIVLAGYSLGGTEAFNTAVYLNRSGKHVEGYKLEAPVPVELLVAPDPVSIPIIKQFKAGQVPPNVSSARSWFQKKRGPLFLRNKWTDASGVVHEDTSDRTWDFSALISGGPFPGAAININVTENAAWENQMRGAQDVTGDMTFLYGRDAQHQSIAWFVYHPNLSGVAANDQTLTTVLRNGLA